MSPAIARLVVAILVCASGAHARAQETSLSGLLQASASHQRFGPYLLGEEAGLYVAEARIDAKVTGNAWELVLRPRLRARHADTDIPGFLIPKQASMTEAYASVDASSSVRLTGGKRYLAWGPGLLYSPSNRLFPDNGSSSPRQEIDGKWMALAAITAGGLQLTALAADPYLQDTPGLDRGGAFVLARAERVATGGREWGWGVVAAGGGGLRPYIGGHLQRLLGEAVTVAVEASASNGYATVAGDAPSLRQNRRHAMADAAVSMRYGLADGGELAIEYVYNGYYLTAAERLVAAIALPSVAGTTQTRYPARHPLAEPRYLNLQANFPKLLGRSRWTLFVRHLEALDTSGRLTFAELGYNATDRLSIYVGATVTHGSASSSLTRSLDRAAYLTFELNC